VKTFRLPKELLLALEKDAQEEGTTVNALVSTILIRYAEWGSSERKLGVISVTRPLLATLLESADPKKLAVVARRRLPTGWRNMALFKYHDVSPESMIRLHSLITKYGLAAALDVRKEEGEYVISCSHQLGRNFSIMLKEGWDELIRTTYHVQPETRFDDELFTIRFSVPDPDSTIGGR